MRYKRHLMGLTAMLLLAEMLGLVLFPSGSVLDALLLCIMLCVGSLLFAESSMTALKTFSRNQ